MKSYRLLLIVCIALATGCSAFKDMKEMKEKTNDMSADMKEMLAHVKSTDETSKKMAENVVSTDRTSGEMLQQVIQTNETSTKMLAQVIQTNKNSSNMESIISRTDRNMDNMYSDTRQAISAQLRKDTYDSLMAALTMKDKLSEAFKYHLTYEYQLWKNSGKDDGAKRLELMDLAATEYFAKIESLVSKTMTDEIIHEIALFLKSPRDYLTKSWHETSKNKDDYSTLVQTNNQRALLALSATMHKVNPSQSEVFVKTGVQPVSMYSMVTKALTQYGDYNLGKKNYEEIPAYIETIQDNAPLAVRLLHFRHNFLAAMAFGKLHEVDTSLWAGVVVHPEAATAELKAKTSLWQLDLTGKGIAFIHKMNLYLQYAVTTKNFLRSIGVNVEANTDRDMMMAYRNMRFDDAIALANKSNKALSGKIINFIETVKEYRKLDSRDLLGRSKI